MQIEIALTALLNAFARFTGPAPAVHRGHFAFEFLVNREKMFDLAAHVREDLVHRMDLVIARIAIGDSEYLLIFLVAVDHVQDAYGTHLDHYPRVAWLLHQNQHVERIVIVRERAGYESVIAGIMQWRIKRAIQPE